MRIFEITGLVALVGCSACTDDDPESGTGPVDTAAEITGFSPSGLLPAGTTDTSMTLTTNEAAMCRYGTSADQQYADMSRAFVETGGVSHETPLVDLVDGATYVHYASCRDAAGNTSAVQVIEFSIDDATTTDPTLAFYSGWDDSLGAGQAAIGDGGKWEQAPNMSTVLEVVEGSVADWTLTPNVLQVTHPGPSFYGFVQHVNDIPDGADFWIRYWAYVRPGWINPMQHPQNMDMLTVQTVFWSIIPAGSTSYLPRLNLAFSSEGGQRHFVPDAPLSHGVWYRFEFHVTFVSTSPVEVRIWPHVYDMENNLLFDASSYVGPNDPTATLQAWYDEGGYNTISDAAIPALELVRKFCFGNEDPGGAGTYPDQNYYFAAVATSLEKVGDFIPGP